MKYALFLHAENGNLPDAMTPAERQTFTDEMNAFVRAAQEKEAFVQAQRLRPDETATTVHVRDGEAIVTDGPFSETKESLAGFFVLDCADLDDALEWAKRIPSARVGHVEVRPLWEGD